MEKQDLNKDNSNFKRCVSIMGKYIKKDLFADENNAHLSEWKIVRQANINLLKGAVQYAKQFDACEVPDPRRAVYAKCYSCMYKSGIRHKDCPDISCPLNPITFGCLYKLRSAA